MNAKAQEFINKKKSELQEKELRERNEHLISLGLVDESKSIEGILYLDSWDGSEKCLWDEEKQKYYKRTYIPAPIELSDDEYQEILKLAPIELKEKKVEVERRTNWAGAIVFAANLFLAISIIAGIYLSMDFGWMPIAAALTYCFLWYPIIIGFSKIVKDAEKNQQE